MLKNLEQIPDILLNYRDRPLQVGFSGGADSTALLLLLLKWGWRAELLEAVHFEHGLRGEASKLDAVWCQEFCRQRGIKFTLVELELLRKCSTGSVEDIARQARLDWYSSHNNNVPIVLAHHRDDAAETLLLKLARGGNSGALTGLRACKKLRNMTILRPLLGFSKSDLEEFLRQNNINDWRLDDSNDSIDYHRNYLRNKLLKEWSIYHKPVINGLLRSREALQCVADFIEECGRKELASLGDELPLTTQVDFWKKLHPALLTRVLPDYVRRVSGGTAATFSRTMFERFRQSLQLLISSESRLIKLSSEVVFELKNQTLTFRKNRAGDLENDPCLWNWHENAVMTFGSWRLSAALLAGAHQSSEKGVFFFDAALVPGEFILNFRQGGEQMQIWGDDKLRRVKHLLSTSAVKDVFLLQDSSKVIYLLGDIRRSAHAPVTGQTVNTLQIKVEYLHQ